MLVSIINASFIHLSMSASKSYPGQFVMRQTSPLTSIGNSVSVLKAKDLLCLQCLKKSKTEIKPTVCSGISGFDLIFPRIFWVCFFFFFSKLKNFGPNMRAPGRSLIFIILSVRSNSCYQNIEYA